MAWKERGQEDRLQYVTKRKRQKIENVLAGMSHTKLIDEYLNSGRTLTIWSALHDLGIGALSQRVQELNKQLEKRGADYRIVNLNADKGGPGCYGEYKMEMTK
jgi:hypothetical protein